MIVRGKWTITEDPILKRNVLVNQSIAYRKKFFYDYPITINSIISIKDLDFDSVKVDFSIEKLYPQGFISFFAFKTLRRRNGYIIELIPWKAKKDSGIAIKLIKSQEIDKSANIIKRFNYKTSTITTGKYNEFSLNKWYSLLYCFQNDHITIYINDRIVITYPIQKEPLKRLGFGVFRIKAKFKDLIIKNKGTVVKQESFESPKDIKRIKVKLIKK